MVAVKNKILLFAICLLIIFLGIVIFPFALIFETIYLITKLFCKIFKKEISELSPKTLAKKILTLNGKLSRFVRSLLNRGLTQNLSEKLRYDAAKNLIRKINHMEEPADI